MPELVLSKRLRAIVDMVDKGSNTFDVGADHGYVSIALSREKIAHRVYAVENKMEPFSHLMNNVSIYAPRVITFISDGLQRLPKDVDCLIIAGLGNRTISSILKKDSMKLGQISTIITDAHSEVPLLRKNIINLGFYIEKEIMLKEGGIFYTIIKFKKGHRDYEQIDMEFGPLLRKEKSAGYLEFYNAELTRLQILAGQNGLSEERQLEIKNYIERIKDNI